MGMSLNAPSLCLLIVCRQATPPGQMSSGSIRNGGSGFASWCPLLFGVKASSPLTLGHGEGGQEGLQNSELANPGKEVAHEHRKWGVWPPGHQFSELLNNDLSKVWALASSSAHSHCRAVQAGTTQGSHGVGIQTLLWIVRPLRGKRGGELEGYS